MWRLQEAKQKFSKLVKCALTEGLQVVTRHGEEVVVVRSVAAYRELSGTDKKDFKTFLLSVPDVEELELFKPFASP